MSEAKIINSQLLSTMPLPAWDASSSKPDYGKLLLIAGSARLPGPAILAARAALRVGCGTVRVAAPVSIATHIGVAVPELMVVPLPETPSGTVALDALALIEAQYKPCDVAIIGPGLDEHEATNELCRQLIAGVPLPSVIDAQALLAFAEQAETADNGTAHGARVWTPHEGELKTLIGQSLEDMGMSREEFAPNFAHDQNSTLVLKGRETLIAAPDGALYKNIAGTRGMGTAGSGDVLAGIIGGLLAQGLEASHAAVWGVHLHALAGEAAAQKFGDDGMMAGDFLEFLPLVLRDMRTRTAEGIRVQGSE